MQTRVPPSHDLKASIDAYASWIEQLRAGKTTSALPLDDENPLARLGQQLQLLEETLREREEQFKQLFNLVENLEKGLTVQDVLDRLFDSFSGLIPYDRIDCALLSDDGRRLTTYWVRSDSPTQISNTYSQPMAGSGLEQILRTNEPWIIGDLEEHLKSNPGLDATNHFASAGGRSNLICPLMVENRPIGFLVFTSNEKNAYGTVHGAILRQIANQISVVIDKIRMYQKIVERNRQLATESNRLERAATHDPLTGILNRGAIVAALERALIELRETGKPIGVVMADIDLFKRVNDMLGHPAGDAALVEFTRRIAASLREGDQIGRYGGEEFLIIAPGATREASRNVAERLRQTVASSPFILGAHQRIITASFGVTVATNADCTVASVIADADQALYAAKSTGRNRIVVA